MSYADAHCEYIVGFVQAEHCGTASLYRINDACVASFPTAADLVMGHPIPAPAC